MRPKVDTEQAARQRRWRDLAERAETVARIQLAECIVHHERLGQKLVLVEAEITSLQQVTTDTAAQAGHRERQIQEITTLVKRLREELAAAREELGQSRRQLAKATQATAGLQQLVDRTEEAAQQHTARTDQAQADERSTWLRAKKD